MDWNDFYQTLSWKELLAIYEEGIAHIERFVAAHPEKDVAPEIVHAIERLTVLHAHVRKAAGVSALLDQPAPPEAVKIIIGAVSQVKRDVPLAPRMGNA